MELRPHLTFDGRCEEAFRFYEQVLGGKANMLTYGDSPMAAEVEPEARTRIVHASLSFPDGELAGADVASDQYEPEGIFVLLGVGEVSDAERIFDALAEDGDVQMPLQETFWSERFGVVVDRFGIPWEVNCEQVSTKPSTEH